ncbi:hypothetical protein [Pseudarthrobacter sp. NPDC080039]
MDSFATLRDKVSAYFSNLGFYVGEDHEDELRENPLIKRWRRDNGCDWRLQCAAIVYPTRSSADMLGSGTLFTLHNNRSTRSAVLVPGAVTRFFSGTPNSISVDTHHFWLGSANWLAGDLAKYLSKEGKHAILLSLDDTVTGVKSNPYLSDEERLLALDAAANAYLPSPASFPALSSSLKSQLGMEVWTALSRSTQEFLISGIVAFDRLDGASTVQLEASGPAILLSKALEDTVVRRLMLPFRRFIASSGTGISSSGDGRLNKLREYALGGQNKKLELGTFASQLAHLATGDTSNLPPAGVAYLAFIQTLSDPDFVQHELADQLLHVTRSFRNPAAHPEVLDFPQLHSYIRLLLGHSGAEGLLPRIVTASKSK